MVCFLVVETYFKDVLFEASHLSVYSLSEIAV